MGTACVEREMPGAYGAGCEPQLPDGGQGLRRCRFGAPFAGLPARIGIVPTHVSIVAGP
jgi:hypothetical protein